MSYLLKTICCLYFCSLRFGFTLDIYCGFTLKDLFQHTSDAAPTFLMNLKECGEFSGIFKLKNRLLFKLPIFFFMFTSFVLHITKFTKTFTQHIIFFLSVVRSAINFYGFIVHSGTRKQNCSRNKVRKQDKNGKPKRYYSISFMYVEIRNIF